MSFPGAASDLPLVGPYQDLFNNTVTTCGASVPRSAPTLLPSCSQLLTNQFEYGSLTFTALTNATRDFAIGLAGIPPVLPTALQYLAAGNTSAAVNVLGEALSKVFYNGLDASNLSNIQLVGTLGDLLPTLSIPGALSQNVTNVITTLTDTNIALRHIQP